MNDKISLEGFFRNFLIPKVESGVNIFYRHTEIYGEAIVKARDAGYNEDFNTIANIYCDVRDEFEEK